MLEDDLAVECAEQENKVSNAGTNQAGKVETFAINADTTPSRTGRYHAHLTVK